MSYRRSNPHSFPTRRSSDLNIKPKGDSFVLSDKVVIKFPGTKAVLRGAEQNRELLVPVNFAGTSSSRFCSAPRRTAFVPGNLITTLSLRTNESPLGLIFRSEERRVGKECGFDLR